jgi:hypothetical protein
MPPHTSSFTPDYHCTFANKFQRHLRRGGDRRCFEFQPPEPCENCDLQGSEHGSPLSGMARAQRAPVPGLRLSFHRLRRIPLILEMGIDITSAGTRRRRSDGRRFFTTGCSGHRDGFCLRL